MLRGDFICRIVSKDGEEAEVSALYPDWHWIEWDFDDYGDWSGSIPKKEFEKRVNKGQYTILNNKD